MNNRNLLFEKFTQIDEKTYGEFHDSSKIIMKMYKSLKSPHVDVFHPIFLMEIYEGNTFYIHLTFL